MSNFDFITVVGVGVRRNGVSKAGNSYDFVPVHIIHDPKPGVKVTGKCAAEVLVDTESYERIRPVPGEEFTVTLSESRGGLKISHWIGRGQIELDLL